MAGAPGMAKGVPGMSVDPNTGRGAQECQGVSGRAWGSQEWQGVPGMAGDPTNGKGAGPKPQFEKKNATAPTKETLSRQ